jgi:hypothetical protein
MSFDVLLEDTFQPTKESATKPCPSCGELMEVESTGRPREFCQKCTEKALKEKKHKVYLYRKYAKEIEGLNEELAAETIKIHELEKQQRVEKNKIKKHKRWLRRYLRRRPGLEVIFSNLTATQREAICNPIKYRAMKLLKKGYERVKDEDGISIPGQQRNAGGSGYSEELWKPKYHRHWKETKFGVFKDGILQPKRRKEK